MLVVYVVGLTAFIVTASLIEEPQTGLPWSPQFEAPLPHRIPKTPDAVSLRFAMVHDVIHERFAKHGRAYYEARNRLVLQALEKERTANAKPAPAYFALLDDLAVGLNAVGEQDEAIRVMRAKLKEQEACNHQGIQLYTTYANLGTFLMLGLFRNEQTTEPDTVEHAQEGLALIRKAIAINPDAHFGREKWQAMAVEFLLAANENPKLLTYRDFCGNSLHDDAYMYRSAWNGEDTLASRVAAAKRFAAAVANPGATEENQLLRDQYITRVGPQASGDDNSGPTYSFPFDEPVLGVIGMWREGGGANPHFCLFLGETMLRVRQRHLAWAAFERAKLMADLLWPDPEIQEEFVEHCNSRQGVTANLIPEKEFAELPKRFTSELEFGLRYQRAYQDFEKAQIEAGADIEDPHFYDVFHRQHGAIASPLGNADTLLVTAASPLGNWPVGLAAGGLAALVASVFLVVPNDLNGRAWRGLHNPGGPGTPFLADPD